MSNRIKLAVIADTHYYSRTIGDCGRAYELRSGSDQKCLAESKEVIGEAFCQIVSDGADALLIAGDVTNNGEKQSHEEFRQMLYDIKKKIPVYIITATHDWCSDDRNNRYVGDRVISDVEFLKYDELRDFYKDFGPSQALSEFVTHLGTSSYVCQLCDGLRLLALNDDQNGKGTGAGFSDEHFLWIEEQLKKAREDGQQVVAVEHHPIIPPVHPMITGGSCVAEREYVASRLADAGLSVIFTGHLHMVDESEFVSEKGNVIHQYALGALCGYPGYITYADFDGETLSIENKKTKYFDFLSDKSFDLVMNVINAATDSKKEFAERLSALGANGEKLSKIYPIAKPLAKFFKKATVGRTYKKIRRLLLWQIPKQDRDGYYNMKLQDAVKKVLLSVFGEGLSLTEDDGLYKRVYAIASFPSKISPDKKVLCDIKNLVEAILKKGKADGNHSFK
ncbi:MAG: metallophosphoesterase [Clostridia bacterium]|nr:metallophosphoesterase [Clostridia bacterium]